MNTLGRLQRKIATLSTKLTRGNPSHGDQGLISIIVTVIIMFVISVTIMSFATITRREQRQVLDRQLNTQAFYAAESGINDAISKLRELSLSDPSNILQSNYTTCGSFEAAITSSGAEPLTPDVSGDANVAYSCLLVNPRPQTLEYKSVDRSPLVIPIKAGAGTLDTVTFNWQATDGSANFNCPGGALAFPNLPSNSEWLCATGLLRVDLVQTPNTFSRDTLNSNMRTLFLYPQPGGAGTFSINPLPANTGQIVNASCVNPPPLNTKFCTARISVPPAQNYYVRISSIYRASSVTLSASSGGSPVELVGAQAMIDSTGRANDVLRRLQVRVSINPLGDGPFPLGAIQSVSTVCKQFSVIPPPKTVAAPGGDPECQIN